MIFPVFKRHHEGEAGVRKALLASCLFMSHCIVVQQKPSGSVLLVTTTARLWAVSGSVSMAAYRSMNSELLSWQATMTAISSYVSIFFCRSCIAKLAESCRMAFHIEMGQNRQRMKTVGTRLTCWLRTGLYDSITYEGPYCLKTSSMRGITSLKMHEDGLLVLRAKLDV